MKFDVSVDIDLPIDKVIDLFVDSNNLKEWQDGFISMDHLSGNPGEPDAKSRLIYKIGRKEIEMIETIKVNNLPEEFVGLYEAKTMVNLMTNNFMDLGGERTRYEAHIEYIKFNGFMPKLMAFLMPGVFKKQTQKWLDQFKAFAERVG
jgi:uncharacterized membrane protein